MGSASARFCHGGGDHEPSGSQSGPNRLADPRQPVREPQHQNDEPVEQHADPDHEVGPPPPIKLGDEVGTQKRQWIRQHAHRQRKRPEMHELGDAQNVEHRHRAEKQPGQHEKHALAPLVQRGGEMNGIDAIGRGHRWLQAFSACRDADIDRAGPPKTLEPMEDIGQSQPPLPAPSERTGSPSASLRVRLFLGATCLRVRPCSHHLSGGRRTRCSASATSGSGTCAGP
jgi:hypothetical protein